MRKISELIDLDNRKALVTGGAGHIGLAVCETLLELGSNVAILDKDLASCRARVNMFKESYTSNIFAVPVDMTDEVQTRESTRSAIELMGGLDIIVHCAAYIGATDVPGWAVKFEDQTVDAWDAAIRVNLTSAFILAQEAKDALEDSSSSSIILFGSTYGLVGPDMSLYTGTDMANPMGYGASKGGIIQLPRYLATVLAPSVRVNSITPGGVTRGQPESFQNRYISKTPLGRMATEEDLKGAVAFLASDLSGYVTGHNLVVDGGWTAW